MTRRSGALLPLFSRRSASGIAMPRYYGILSARFVREKKIDSSVSPSAALGQKIVELEGDIFSDSCRIRWSNMPAYIHPSRTHAARNLRGKLHELDRGFRRLIPKLQLEHGERLNFTILTKSNYYRYYRLSGFSSRFVQMNKK